MADHHGHGPSEGEDPPYRDAKSAGTGEDWQGESTTGYVDAASVVSLGHPMQGRGASVDANSSADAEFHDTVEEPNWQGNGILFLVAETTVLFFLYYSKYFICCFVGPIYFLLSEFVYFLVDFCAYTGYLTV